MLFSVFLFLSLILDYHSIHVEFSDKLWANSYLPIPFNRLCQQLPYFYNTLSQYFIPKVHIFKALYV